MQCPARWRDPDSNRSGRVSPVGGMDAVTAAMARPGLEPGTPRFSVVLSRYLNPAYFQGIFSLSQRLRGLRFPGLCVRLPGVTADGRARLPFRWAGELLLRSATAVAIALLPPSCLAGPPTSASAARTPGASRGRRRAPAARESSRLRLAGAWPLLGWSAGISPLRARSDARSQHGARLLTVGAGFSTALAGMAATSATSASASTTSSRRRGPLEPSYGSEIAPRRSGAADQTEL